MRRGSFLRMSSGSGSIPCSRAIRCASDACGSSSSRTSTGAATVWESSGCVPPRTGSRSRNTSQASTKLGNARMTKAARQESAETPPLTANPKAAPINSPEMM